MEPPNMKTNINLPTAVILRPKPSLYDLQKLSYEFCDNHDCKKRFFAIYAKTDGGRA